jgi:RNA polymerase sigma-70 factor (ECF subfamily)
MAEAVHEEFLKAYRPVHTQFARYCSNHAYGIMDAEDLVQETVLATLQRFEQIREKEKLLGYMISAANNILRNVLRRKKFTGDYNEKAFRKLESNSVNAEVALDIHHLHLALQQLPVKDKEAILLFEISGFSIEEIAVIQESSAGATKTRLSRARDKLRKLMLDEVPEQEAAPRMNKLFTLL